MNFFSSLLYYLFYFFFYLQTGRRRRPTAAGACALDTRAREQKEYRLTSCTGCLIGNEHYCRTIIYIHAYISRFAKVISATFGLLGHTISASCVVLNFNRKRKGRFFRFWIKAISVLTLIAYEFFCSCFSSISFRIVPKRNGLTIELDKNRLLHTAR